MRFSTWKHYSLNALGQEVWLTSVYPNHSADLVPSSELLPYSVMPIIHNRHMLQQQYQQCPQHIYHESLTGAVLAISSTWRLEQSPSSPGLRKSSAFSQYYVSSRDTKLLCLQRFTRLFAYGASTLVLALYLSSLGSSDARIGLFMTLTLLGDVVISFLLTLVADGLGRRRILVLGAALMTASGIVLRHQWELLDFGGSEHLWRHQS